jgi:uncharacterized protein YdeI (YjbR/CyaY-like superfamily)
MKLVDEGVKAPPRPKSARKKEVIVPPALAAALAKNAKARATFEAFPNGKRKEYVNWINDAKREQTRVQRLATAVEWLAEGKALYWKYESK